MKIFEYLYYLFPSYSLMVLFYKMFSFFNGSAKLLRKLFNALKRCRSKRLFVFDFLIAFHHISVALDGKEYPRIKPYNLTTKKFKSLKRDNSMGFRIVESLQWRLGNIESDQIT